MSVLQPSQIVCANTPNYQFFGEVIDVVTEREVCWVRPLLLVKKGEEDIKIDVRQGSDIVFPLSCFEPALDGDILPFLNDLVKDDYDGSSFIPNHPQLTQFLRELLNQDKL
ncbi:MAG: hypothetical protein AB4041_18375 [Microcystaceae cyanobacterium]